MTTTQPQPVAAHYQVRNGPSIDRIMDSFRYTYAPECQVPAMFDIKPQNIGAFRIDEDPVVQVEVTIISMEQTQEQNLLMKVSLLLQGSMRRATMIYSTKTRRGGLSIGD